MVLKIRSSWVWIQPGYSIEEIVRAYGYCLWPYGIARQPRSDLPTDLK